MAGDDGILEITPALSLPWRELEFRASPAGGPGGQHANRSSTRIEVWWDVATSPALTEAQRALLLERLAHRLDSTGHLRLVSGETRSQAQNRQAVLDRLRRVVAAALKVSPPRRPTRPTRASVERRLETKKRRAATKRERRPPDEH